MSHADSLLLHLLNGRPPKKRDYEAAFVGEYDDWGDDAGVNLDI